MALSGIELRYLVDTITEQVQGYYISNIYGITKDSILFKLHHTEKSDLFMMISTSGVWLTAVKIDQLEPNRLLKRLRSDLLRLKLKKIEQIGAERIAYFTFEGFGKELVLVGEFFGDGNILLCNKDMKILALQHSIDVRHRKLRVGLEYAVPPKSELDIFNLKESDETIFFTVSKIFFISSFDNQFPILFPSISAISKTASTYFFGKPKVLPNHFAATKSVVLSSSKSDSFKLKISNPLPGG
jgi:predicted ribosome quality control (RQC) complex YloA/Tae2 family protein